MGTAAVGEGGFEPPTACPQSRCATTAPLPVYQWPLTPAATKVSVNDSKALQRDFERLRSGSAGGDRTSAEPGTPPPQRGAPTGHYVTHVGPRAAEGREPRAGNVLSGWGFRIRRRTYRSCGSPPRGTHCGRSGTSSPGRSFSTSPSPCRMGCHGTLPTMDHRQGVGDALSPLEAALADGDEAVDVGQFQVQVEAIWAFAWVLSQGRVSARTPSVPMISPVGCLTCGRTNQLPAG